MRGFKAMGEHSRVTCCVYTKWAIAHLYIHNTTRPTDGRLSSPRHPLALSDSLPQAACGRRLRRFRAQPGRVLEGRRQRVFLAVGDDGRGRLRSRSSAPHPGLADAAAKRSRILGGRHDG